jgi:glycosyltransferase involved in cell wall biosynthesis
MRIVFVTPRSWPAPGGRERLLHDLSRALAAEHDVEVLARQADGPRGPAGRRGGFAPFDDGPVRVSPLELPVARQVSLAPLVLQRGRLASVAATRALAGPLSAWYGRVVAPLVERAITGADVVHAWSGGYHAAAAQGAARRLGVPVVVTPHLHPGQWGETPDAVRTYRRAAAVVAYLPPEAERLVELGVPRAAVVQIPACSPRVADGDPEGLRRRHGISGPVVLFLGARRAYKGLDLLLRAAPAVATAVPGTTFVLAGPGPGAVEPGGARVVDVGEVSEEERAGWLAAADVLCLPSEFESFGLVVLEAWSAATPAVVSDIPALRALVAAGGGGLSVTRTSEALADGLVRVLGDERLRRELGDAGRAWWRGHATPSAVAERHVELYERLSTAWAPSRPATRRRRRP